MDYTPIYRIYLVFAYLCLDNNYRFDSFYICPFLLRYCRSIQMQQFDMVNVKMGAPRLSTNKPVYRKTRTACALTCLTDFHDQCRGFMYNSETSLCTPCKWPNHESPNIEDKEGQLYAFRSKCDYSKEFSMYEEGGLAACLRLYPKGRSYQDALSECQGHGDQCSLASVQTRDKISLLGSVVDHQMDYWIGLDDRKKEDQFEWTLDQTQLTSDQRKEFFKDGEPSNTNNEDCIVFKYQNEYKVLRDDNCDATAWGAVCEIRNVV